MCPLVAQFFVDSPRALSPLSMAENYRREKGYSHKIPKDDAMQAAVLEWSEVAAARQAAKLEEAARAERGSAEDEGGVSGGDASDEDGSEGPPGAGDVSSSPSKSQQTSQSGASAVRQAVREREARQRELMRKKLAWRCTLCGQARNPPKVEKCATCGRPRGYEPALRSSGANTAPPGVPPSAVEHKRAVFDGAFAKALALVDSHYWVEHRSVRDIVASHEPDPPSPVQNPPRITPEMAAESQRRRQSQVQVELAQEAAERLFMQGEEERQREVARQVRNLKLATGQMY